MSLLAHAMTCLSRPTTPRGAPHNDEQVDLRKRWPGKRLSIPAGLELYLKEEQAKALNGPYRSTSQLGRDMLDFIAEQVSTHQIRALYKANLKMSVVSASHIDITTVVLAGRTSRSVMGQIVKRAGEQSKLDSLCPFFTRSLNLPRSGSFHER
jgi:hypothetical protein